MRRALAFLTSLGGAAEPDADSVSWFPAVGLLVGLAVGGVWWGAGEVWAAPIAAALAVATDLALTGMLHLDGLADSADGLLPHLSRERRLEVMKEPDVGAFGLGVVVTVLLLRFAALAGTEPEPWAVAGCWMASRSAMAAILRHGRAARPGGLSAAFAGGGAPLLLVAGVTVALGLAVADAGVRGAAAVVAVAIGAFLVLRLATARIGGFTGDVLGAAGMVGETLALLVLAAHP